MQNKNNNLKMRFIKLKITISIFLFVLICIYGVFNTQLGTQFVLQSVSQISGGTLTFTGVNGHLIDQFSIDELQIKNSESHIVARRIEIHWQWSRLIKGELLVNSMKISSLKIASIQNTQSVKLPKNLALPFPVNLQEISIGRLALHSLVKGQTPEISEKPNHYFSSIAGSYSSTEKEQKIQAGLTSEWGKITVSSNLGNTFPYLLKGNFLYQGVESKNVPELKGNGQFTGELQDFSVSSSISSSSNKTMNSTILLRLKPFEKQILTLAKIHLTQFNPSSIHKEAPNAALDIFINLVDQHKDQFLLGGQIDISNSQPKSLDKNGLQFTSISTIVNN
jgi:hypothetical protein